MLEAVLRAGQRRPRVSGEPLATAQPREAVRLTREAVDAYSRDRIARIYQWQQEINLSVLPLSAGEETLPQVRKLMGRLALRRRVR